MAYAVLQIYASALKVIKNLATKRVSLIVMMNVSMEVALSRTFVNVSKGTKKYLLIFALLSVLNIALMVNALHQIFVHVIRATKF